VPCSRQIL